MRCVVLVTGHPGVGKSTFARPLADAIGAVCLSRDEVRFRVYDGWRADGAVGPITPAENEVVWSVWFWAVREAARVAPVVAETAMTQPANRDAVLDFVRGLDVPVLEVLLRAPLHVLVGRYRARLASPDAHRVYRTYPAESAHTLLSQEYAPVLDADRVIEVDATALDAGDVARRVREMLTAPGTR